MFARAIRAFGFRLSALACVFWLLTGEVRRGEAANGPLVTDIIPAGEAPISTLTTVEIFFSEDVTEVDAGDLLINGVPATDMASFGANQYVFSFPEPAAGQVTVSWAPNHRIRDLTVEANPFTATAGWTYQLDPTLLNGQAMISEFMADNDKTLRDEDGDSSDWIEIYNPTDAPLDLTGWFLSHDPLHLARWRFPAIALEPKSFVVVFASDKNRAEKGSKLHTNFKLSSNGGFVGLSNPATNLISSFAYAAQRKDVSYGREPGEPPTAGFFAKPTPGSANAVGGTGFAPAIQFSRKGGTFLEPFELVLTPATPGAVIYYSINGKNLPTESSNLYTGPIQITNTTHVRARAFLNGLLPGQPRSESYIALSNTVRNVTSDLPLVVLHNSGGGTVPATGEQFVMMQVFEPKNGVASLTNAPDLSERARFRRRGSSTQDYPKWSFALETWDEFNNDKKISFLGLPEESDWNLYAPNNFETVLIHNPFMYQLSRDIGRYASRTRFVEVYLNTRGGSVASNNYFGIYVLEEKIKRGADRVNVDKLEPEHLKEPEVTGGYMIKIDRPDPGDNSFSAAGQGDWNYVDPKGPVIRTAARDPQEQYILGYLRTLGTVLGNPSLFKDPVAGYAKYVDVPASIDHHILNVLAFNVDALRLSTYLHKPRNGKLAWGPIWDFDRALGSTDGRDANPRQWGDSGGLSFFQHPIWSRMFQDIDFWQKWIDRWEELRSEQLSTNYMHRLIDQLMGEVRKAQPREMARWKSSAQVRVSYQNEINLMKKYVADRSQYIDNQLVRPPVLELGAGRVARGTTATLRATNTIYYTLDGSDPRLPGGAISPRALLYQGPLGIGENARLVARAHKPGHAAGPTTTARSPWSGRVAATYVVTPPVLAITEIMYHPAAAGSGNTNETSAFEFIELANTGSQPLDLAGYTFSEGIDFTFGAGPLEPGGRILVVKNRGAFESRHGTGARIAGEFTGSLDNSGEHLVLTGPFMEPVAEVTYDNGWYPITDGTGFSLVLRDESAVPASYNDRGVWRASARFNGSPSAVDPAPTVFPSIYINEVLPHPSPGQLDKVEVFNAGPTAVNLSGWFLTDDFATPKKFKIPAGTVIPAQGFVVFDEGQFKPGPNGFAFAAGGDQIYLFSADANGELTGYVHGFQFGAAAAGRAFGRWQSQDGREHLVAETETTFGGPNSPPLSGPIVINEVMFQPIPAGIYDNTLDEYIELRNLTSARIFLGDPTHSFRLRGAVDFDFPADAEIPPHGFALAVNFDPSSGLAAEFRSRFEVPPATPLFGPFGGKLANSGEHIRLSRPDETTFDTPEDVAYILMDEVNYATQLPWPTGANGTGRSLQRISTGPGNDPFAWIAGSPTPGRETVETDPDGDRDGLPTEWETRRHLNPASAAGLDGAEGDPDADGLTNWQEYVAGTDPLNPASNLRLSAMRTATGTRLAFSAAADRTYSILFKSNLTDPGWTKLSDIDATGVDREFALDDPSPKGSRFYRVVTPRQ